MAADYDDAFTSSLIGGLMRRAVWRRLDPAFHSGERVLELNCGTGEDARYLARRGVRVLATDASAPMLEVARAKVVRAGLQELVEFQRLDLNRIPGTIGDTYFDGAFSNFGGLNCVADLGVLAAGLARLLRPGASALLCVMGPLAPWEWVWYGVCGDAQRALRRLRPGGVFWRGLRIRYPTIGALRRAFAPHFRFCRVAAVGALLPPSYAEPWARRHPALLHALARVERTIERVPPVPWFADHYLIELERR